MAGGEDGARNNRAGIVSVQITSLFPNSAFRLSVHKGAFFLGGGGWSGGCKQTLIPEDLAPSREARACA